MCERYFILRILSPSDNLNQTNTTALPTNCYVMYDLLKEKKITQVN